jgi:hypothetical protein
MSKGENMVIGDRVYIKKEFGYHDISTYIEDFKRAREDLHGFIDAIKGNIYYLTLDNGLRVKTSDFAIVKE